MIANFVMQTANAPGNAGTFNLIAPPVDRLSFVAAFGNGGQSYYFLDDDTQAEWGIGTVTAGSPDQFTRSTVIGNTAGTTARLNFSGSVRVYNDSVAGYLPYLDNNKLLTLPSGLSIVARQTEGMAIQLRGRSSDNLAYIQFTDYAGATDFGRIQTNAAGLHIGIGTGQPLNFDTLGNVTFGNNLTAAPSGGQFDGAAWRPGSGWDSFCATTVATFGCGGTTGTTIIQFRNGGNASGSITVNGASAVSFNTSSDARLKTIDGPLAGALDRLAQIPTYRGRWKQPPAEQPAPDPETGELPPPAPWIEDKDAVAVDMILAHEVAAVVPDAVTGAKDAVDAAGNPVWQQWDSGRLIVLLVACVNELRAKVQLLEQGANAMSGTHKPTPHPEHDAEEATHESEHKGGEPPKAPPAGSPDHVKNPPGHPEHQGQ